MASMAIQDESEASFSRITRDGRKLTYEMRVLQQPQRARACGSGAKSSADRRPVDPPPVIELKVFEGEQKTDITFNHKANFFVYTTLEVARPIAQPRGQPISQPPVLTGSPVSGAALLDRPSPAAYFIFPDLSVRHEGKYRLGFNLFEELKDPKDEDATPSAGNPAHPAHPLMGGSDQSSVHFRLEVRSKPFTVYSAKKFPGLTESTTLSRVVAEQGCRVRIRRDVRMRRRENKGSKDGGHDDDCGYGSYSEPSSAVDPYRQPTMEQQPQPGMEQGYYASPAYQAPQYMHHARPASQPQYHPVQAAPAAEQAGIPPNPYGPAYSSSNSSQPHTRHPSLASNHESASSTTSISVHQQPVAPAPQQQAAPPAPMPHPQVQQQPPTGVARGPYTHPFHDTIGLGSKSIYYNDQVEAARTLAIDNPYVAQSSYPDPRSSTPNGTAHSLPPLKSLQPPSDIKVELPSGASSVAVSTAASPIYEAKSLSNTYSTSAMSGRSAAASVRAGAKRGYDRVFDDGSRNGTGPTLANGARQDTCGQDVPQVATEEGLIDLDSLLSMKHLMYRRANGSMQTRKISTPGES